MEKITVDQLVERIYGLLGEKLGVTGRTLEARVRRAGRVLPRFVRQAAKELVSADQMSRAPKMLLRIDSGQVSAAYATCLKHLEAIDQNGLRSQARFSLAATIIVQICLVAAVLLTVLRWRGFV